MLLDFTLGGYHLNHQGLGAELTLLKIAFFRRNLFIPSAPIREVPLPDNLKEFFLLHLLTLLNLHH